VFPNGLSNHFVKQRAEGRRKSNTPDAAYVLSSQCKKLNSPKFLASILPPVPPPPRAHAAVTSDDHGPPLERRSDSFSIFTFGYRLRRTTEYIGEQMGMCRETLRRAFELGKQT
jgi:hypothetical protein